MAADVIDRLWAVEDVVDLLDAVETPPKARPLQTASGESGLRGDVIMTDTVSPEIFEAAAKYTTICLGIIAVCATVVGSVAFYPTERGAARTFSLLIERAGALQLITVLSIIAAACLLTLLGRISSEGIVSILSGIAGYVLGGSQLFRRQPEDHEAISN
jgi:hypothetical protein